MPGTVNKQRLLNQIFTTLKKPYGEPADPAERPVLEQMIFGLLREGAPQDAADIAFERLKAAFYDWNEVRVSSPHEIEDALKGLPQAGTRAQRVIALLQEVFESTYSFDLDSLHKKGLKQSAKQISRYQATNDFTVAWVTQQSLGGHAIPVDAPLQRVVIRLGLVDPEENAEGTRATLEHQVPKAKGPVFVTYLSRIAAEVCHEGVPDCPACPLRNDCLTGQTVTAKSPSPSSRGKAKPR